MTPTSHLKTQQVAEALGVSVSTVKRWVDSGDLIAARTVGKHRLIPAATALAFARDRGLPQGRLEALADGRDSAEVAIDDQSRAALLDALAAGRSGEVNRLIAGAHATGGAASLGDDLIRPVMERVGHRWKFGILDIYEEHRATQILESSIRELLRDSARRTPDRAPLALGATPEGDTYTLSGLLCELTLRDLGWDAVNLGPNLPLDSLSRAVRQQRPRLVWLSVSCLPDPAGFLRQYRAFHEAIATTGTAVVLGGRALNADLRSKLVATSFGDCLAHFQEFARRWQAASRPSEPSTGPAPDRGTDGEGNFR